MQFLYKNHRDNICVQSQTMTTLKHSSNSGNEFYDSAFIFY